MLTGAADVRTRTGCGTKGNRARLERVSKTFGYGVNFGGGMAANGYISAGLLVALFAFATACADDRDSRVSAEESPSAPASSTTTDESLPAASTSEKGVRVAVPSHCGILGLTVKGRLWLADPPLGDHNPPPGWDENETMGILLETGPGRAVFKGDGGQRAWFQRAPRGAEDPNAGCE
jgi:hypothetical protein